MFGRALIAITNVSGSGKKLTLRSLEVLINTIAGSALAQTCKAVLYKGASISGGEDLVLRGTDADSVASLPSTVVISRNGYINTYANVLRAITPNRNGAAAGTQNMLHTQKEWSKFGCVYSSAKRYGASILEPITINNGEAIALVPTIIQASSPMRITVVFSYNNKTFSFSYFAIPRPGTALFALENDDAIPVKLLSVGLQEVGTTDTPYLRLVPIGQIYQNNLTDAATENIKAMPMDSNYPALDMVNICQLNSDVGFIPSGVPESYLSDASAGTPKGYNYLHTKDFQGPTFKVLFPEMECNKPGAAAENMLGHHLNHRMSDIGVCKSGITLNPGEGIAIVASAETAVAVQTAYSGWTSLNFSAQIDVEPSGNPFLTLTGLQTGSDIVILNAGTTSAYQDIDAYSSSSWSWNYDPDLVTMVDICVYKVGFKPLVLKNISLTTTGATIPIQQTIDLNYSNS